MRPRPRPRRRASALLTVVLLTAFMAILTGSMLSYTLSERRGNERNRLILRARNMAENISVYAAEQLTTKLYRLRNQSPMAFLTGGNEIYLPPASVLDSSFTDHAVGMEVRAGLTSSTGLQFLDPNDAANIGNPNAGLQVSTSSVPIIAKATATHPSVGTVTSYLRHDMEVAMVPLFQFAVFYNMDMEFGPGADMTIAGPVHTNGALIARMQTGRTNTLQFDDRVTAVGGFYANTAHKGPTYMGDGSKDDGPGGTGALNFTHQSTGKKTPIKTSKGVWRDHKYGGGSETTTSINNFKTFATSTYGGNLRTSAHEVSPLVLPSISNYRETDDPQTDEDDRDNGRQIIEAPAAADTAGLKETKFARRSGLYIIVNPDDEERVGLLPDATPVLMRPRSYRCWLNTVNANLSHTLYEVVLPGQPSYGTLNAHVNTLPNAYRVNTSVGHNQVLRIPQGAGVDLADTGYGGPAIPTFPDISDAYFYDLRRSTGNTGHPQYRSGSNVFTPRPIAKIDFDMTRFKMAVERSLFGRSSSTVYNLARPNNSTWGNFVFNPAATPSSHGLGIGPGFNLFPSESPITVIQKSATNAYAPGEIVIRAWEQPGNGNAKDLAARFVIADSTDGVTFTDRYTSAADEHAKIYTPSASITHLRVRLYLDGAAPHADRLCDEEIIPVVPDDGTLRAVLSNDYHVVATSNGSGNPPNWAVGDAFTEMRIFVGGTDDTANWTFAVDTAAGSTTGGANGSFGTGLNAHRFTLNALTSNTGTVRLKATKGGTSVTKTITVVKQASVPDLSPPANQSRWISVASTQAADPFRIYFAPEDPSSTPVAVAPVNFIDTATTATSPWYDGVTVYIHSADSENRTLTSGEPARIDSGVRLWHGRGHVVSLSPSIDAGYAGRTGFSFVTNDPVYVVGHFNADGAITTGTSNPGGASSRYPESTSEMLTAVMGDATTVLSQPVFDRSGSSPNYTYFQEGGWCDSLSGHRHHDNAWSSNWRTSNPGGSNARDGRADTVKAAAMPNLVSLPGSGSNVSMKFRGATTEISACFLIGIVPTNHNPTGLTNGAPSPGANGQTSGGVHNYPRLLEYWDGDLYIRGSMVAMFESRVAMEPWSIRYYNAPGRFWGLHQSLRTAGHDLPLEPMLLTARRMGFKEITAAEYATQKTEIEALPH